MRIGAYHFYPIGNLIDYSLMFSLVKIQSISSLPLLLGYSPSVKPCNIFQDPSTWARIHAGFLLPQYNPTALLDFLSFCRLFCHPGFPTLFACTSYMQMCFEGKVAQILVFSCLYFPSFQDLGLSSTGSFGKPVCQISFFLI